MDLEFRAFTPDLEVRSRGGKRLLSGIVIPYGVDTRIDSRLVERFTSGAFDHQLRSAHRVAFLSAHSIHAGTMQLGHGAELRNDARGLWGEFRVVDSWVGDHYLALVKEESLTQWSAGFTPERQFRDGDVTVRTRAHLFEVAMVPEGAYGELAAVSGMRERMQPAERITLRRDELVRRLPPAR